MNAAEIKHTLSFAAYPERALNDYNKFSSLIDSSIQEHPHFIYLLKIFGQSFFLSDWIIRFPEESFNLLNSTFLKNKKSLKDFNQELKVFEENDEATFIQNIIHYKYQEFLRITVKDFSASNCTSSILDELSYLALAITQSCYRYACKIFKIDANQSYFFILGQGKLGGNEINYSSDIDIQFIYQSDHLQLTNSQQAHEFYIQLAKKILQFLEHRNSEGFLYRVDLDLRPEGKSGTLVNSIDSLEYYYESFGQNWERQALIRTQNIAGDVQCSDLFLKMIQPFVWKKNLDEDFLQQIKMMKLKIHQSLEKKINKCWNVKLGEGGIRDAEFFTQALQMIYGGKNLNLRKRNTVEALQALVNENILKEEDALQVKEAYLFLRKCENRLQALEERQTQQLPHSKIDLIALARRMGYEEEKQDEAYDHFLDDLKTVQELISKNFKLLFN